MKRHQFKVGDEIYFLDKIGLCAFGEVVGVHGPWLWVDDGGGLHTVNYLDAHYDAESVPEEKPEAIW